MRFNSFFQYFINAVLPKRCLACDEPSGSHEFCAFCQSTIHLEKSKASQSFALFVYAGALSEAIRAAKFGPSEIHARGLGNFLKRQSLPPIEADLVTFVPCHWRRRWQRGFDLPPILAAIMARALQLPLQDTLVCARFDPPLSVSQSKTERQKMTASRYRTRVPTLEGKRVLLVDDVITTGSTLLSAANALESIGAQTIPFALAHVP